MRRFTLVLLTTIFVGSGWLASDWQLPSQPDWTLLQHPYWQQQPYPHDVQAQDILARALIAAGHPISAPHWRQLAPDNDYWTAQRRGADLFRAGTRGSCTLNLQFHAGQPLAELTSQRLAAELQQNWSATALDLCWQRATPVSCTEPEGRAFCQLPERQEYHTVGIGVAPRGRANTRNGEVFVPTGASFSLFQHELGHALGLADEYPMRFELAEQFCSGQFNFMALNIVVTRGSYVTPAEYDQLKSSLPWRNALEQRIGVYLPERGRWLLGSPEPNGIGLYAADTCQGTEFQAWKPVAERTFMEQHEIGAVPPLYLELIEEHWQRQ